MFLNASIIAAVTASVPDVFLGAPAWLLVPIGFFILAGVFLKNVEITLSALTKIPEHINTIFNRNAAHAPSHDGFDILNNAT